MGIRKGMDFDGNAGKREGGEKVKAVQYPKEKKILAI
jgi:hypothetical protein